MFRARSEGALCPPSASVQSSSIYRQVKKAEPRLGRIGERWQKQNLPASAAEQRAPTLQPCSPSSP